MTVLIGLIDLPGLIQQGRRRELAVAAGLLLFGFLAAVFWAMAPAAPTIGAMLQWLAAPIIGGR
ncbi:MAG TPA: hypothetical protein VD969_13480 [Symbiobacteriaceae bacterium]|nr:hypothetical protein [Symbiobacteriaceae bacterium]